MAKLYDYTNEEVVTLPDEEVNQLILSGSHSFLKNDTVHVKDSGGNLYKIPADKAHLALQDGFDYAGQKDVEFTKLKNYVSSRPGTSFLLGALRTSTFGYSDKVLQDMGVSSDIIKLYRDENRFSSISGEALPYFSRLTPIGGAMAIGKGVAKTALKGKIKGKVAGDVVEGAIAASPIAISESILNEKPNLSAEQIMAGAGFNFLGNNIARVIGRGGGLLGEKGKSLADYLYYRSIGARTPEYNKLTKFGMNRDRMGQIGRRMRELQQQGQIKSLGDHEDILNTLQDTLIPETGQKLNAVLKEVRKKGAGLSEGELMEKGLIVSPDMIAQRMRTEIRSQFKDPTGELIPENQLPKAIQDLLGKADREIDEIRKLSAIDFFSLETQKRLYSKLKDWNKPLPGTSVSNGMDKIYGAMSKVLREESENVLQRVERELVDEMDTGLVETFRQLKHDYGDMRDLEMLMSASVRRESVNNTFGLTSMNLGAGLGAGGVAAGDTILGSIGGGATGLLAGAVLRKLAKDKGELIAARTLDNVLDMTGALGNVSRSRNIMLKSVKALVKGASKTVPVVAARTYPDRKSSEDSMKQFFKMREDLEKVMGSDQSLYASIEQAMPFMQGNEKIQGAVMQTAARGISFLHTKLPKNPLAGMELTMPRKPYAPNPAEVSKFFRYEEIVNEPLKILGHLINGTLTPEHREALISVYPELYKNMQEEILKGLAQGKPNMTLPQKIQLSIFMGKPVDPTMTYLANFQQSFMGQDEDKFKPKDRKIKGLKDQVQTDVERVS
ncbi:hypothetical protein CMO96_02530 [Candidatus Woesebacteria bacterium]|nr:hypothetical protein [Candidatus Woesebacteria bacterium]